MRYLHAISPVEMFIASGSYRDQHLNVSQQWTIHQLPDQAWMIRVDHVPQNILIEAWRSPEGSVERVDIRTLNPPPHRINYLLENGQVEYGHTIGKDQRHQQSFDLPQPLLTLPSIIGISLALAEWHNSAPTVVMLDLLTLDLISFQTNTHDWQKPFIQFTANGIPQSYQDQTGATLTLSDFAAKPSFNLSQRENP